MSVAYITCNAILPAQHTIRRGESLNVLLVMQSDKPTTAPVRLWGCDGTAWRELLREQREFPQAGHVHLYFNISADRFLAPFWGGQAPEEVALYVGDAPPQGLDAGVLVFVQD